MSGKSSAGFCCKRAIFICLFLLGIGLLPAPNALAAGWSQVNTDGFGIPDNRWADAMTVFNGYIYAATGDNNSTGAGIWRSLNGTSWEQVGVDGLGDANNKDVYPAGVLNGKLYIVTWNLATGAEVWRSTDGTSFEQINVDGFGDPKNTKSELVAVDDPYIYTGTENTATGAQIWRYSESTTWTQVNDGGFGDLNNRKVTPGVVYGGNIYTGTQNNVSGGEVWRYRSAETTWTQINLDGFGDVNNRRAGPPAIFNGQLYVGAGRPAGGATVYRYLSGSDWTTVTAPGFGDANNVAARLVANVWAGQLFSGTFNTVTGAEIWKTTDGNNWQQVNADGFGDANNIEVWPWLIESGNLYAGTYNAVTGGEIWRTDVSAPITTLETSPTSADGLNGWFKTVPSVTLSRSEPGVSYMQFDSTNPAGFIAGDATTAPEGKHTLYYYSVDTAGNTETIRNQVIKVNTTPWQQVSADGFGAPQNAKAYATVVNSGFLYTGVWNPSAGGEIWRTTNGTNWDQVASGGFGDPVKSGIWASSVFNGYIYAGADGGGPSGVWRSSNGSTWEPVVTDGFGDANNISIDPHVVFNGYLYAGTPNNITGGEMWRSSNGTTWNQVGSDGFGDPNNRNMKPQIVFKGYIYAYTGNPIAGGQIWRSANGSDWSRANPDNFGNPNNRDIGNQMAEFNGYLYSGVANYAEGAQVWRTANGTDWEQVASGGINDTNNKLIRGLSTIGNYIYAGTQNNVTGAEVWRSSNGTGWEQINSDGFGDRGNYMVHAWFNQLGNSIYVAVDNNAGAQVWALQVATDTTAPVTTLETSPTPADGLNGWFKTVPSITLSRSEPGVSYMQFDSTNPAGFIAGDTTVAPEGEHALYFYSVDTAGNTETVKNQLIKVDTTPPIDPYIISSVPATGTPSTDNTVSVLWSGAADSVSGVDMYSIGWTQNTTGTPDDTPDLPGTATSTVSPPLSVGNWYFNLRTRDKAGNWTSTVHYGPFNIIGNMVVNPGFETGDFTGWNASTTWTVTSTDSHSGSYSALYQPGIVGYVNDSGQPLHQNNIQFDAGKWYTVTAWLKQVDTADGTDPANPAYSPNHLTSAARNNGVYLNYGGDQGKWVSLDPPVLTSETGWVLRTRTYFVPQDATHEQVGFRFIGKALNLNSRILIDDVSIIEETSPPATVSAGAIDTWVLQNSNNQTQEIVEDDSGYLWIGLGWGGGIVKWDKRLESIETSYPAGSPYDASTLKLSATGDIMYASWDGDKVGVLDPDTGTLDETATPLNSEPVGPSEDDLGNFWFAEHVAGTLAKWDRTAGTTERFSLPQAGAEPGYLIKGQGGKLWFTNQLGGGLGYYDTGTNSFGPMYSVGPTNSWPAVISQDSGGKIWVPLRYGNKVVKFDPSTETTVASYDLPTPLSGPQGTAIDRLGNIWVAQSWDGSIAKIDPNTGAITEYRKKESGENTKFLYADNNGDIWFGSRFQGTSPKPLLNRLKNTQPGANVKVGLFDQDAKKTRILATFANISTPGETGATTQSAPGPAPGGYSLRGETWNLASSASYTGQTTVGITYDETSLAGSEANVKLLHWGGGSWTDITTSLDTTNNIVYGQTNSLSPFTVALNQDFSAPSTPTIAGFAPSATQITLSWAAATDNVGVSGYKIFDADTDSQVAATTVTSRTFSGLTPSTFYAYYIKAYDDAGNVSSVSNTVRIKPGGGGDTPADTTVAPVTVLPNYNVSLTFDDITAGGSTNVTVTPAPPGGPTSGFNFLGNQYDITTTASFVGPILISLRYNDADVSGNEADLKIFHFEGGVWKDVTVSVDTVNNIVTGRVTSLSPFILGGPAPAPATGVNENVLIVLALLAVSSGAAIIRNRARVRRAR